MKETGGGAGLARRIIHSDRAGIVIAAMLICIVFTAQNENFFSWDNLINILVAGSSMGLVAIGESYLMIAGHIDLSPGAVAAFSGVLVGVLLGMGLPAGIALVVVIAVGVFIGFLSSVLVTRLNLAPFISTLAMMQIVRGAAYLINDGKAASIYDEAYLKIGSGRLLGVPIPVWIFLLAVVVFTFLLKKTMFGRNIYLLGGNSNAARLSGINPRKLVSKVYMIAAGLSALSGAILAARMCSGHPAASNGIEMDAVTAAVMGGVAMSGGVGSLTGVVLGIFILQGFNNGLSMMHVSSFWQYVAKGSLLVVALSLEYLRNRSKQRRKA